MTLKLTGEECLMLLAIVKYYTEDHDIYAESKEAIFLIKLLAKLKERK